jgi:hypothetical protein
MASLEKLEKDQKKLINLVDRIGEVDEQLRTLNEKIDSFVERLLTSNATSDDDPVAALNQMHEEERLLGDDLAKRREATLILRQRVRSALVELRRAKEPTPDVQEAFTRIFVSSSMTRSMGSTAATIDASRRGGAAPATSTCVAHCFARARVDSLTLQ